MMLILSYLWFFSYVISLGNITSVSNDITGNIGPLFKPEKRINFCIYIYVTEVSLVAGNILALFHVVVKFVVVCVWVALY